MNERVLHNRPSVSEQPFGKPSRVRRICTRIIPEKIRRRFRGIGSRLTLLVVSLITLLTLGTAFLVMNVMDDVLLQSMIKRGSASVQAIAGSAGYSILADDRLALDNLAAQGKLAQEDLVYVAILDGERNILAHNRLELTGTVMVHKSGPLVMREDGLQISQISRLGRGVYEFSLPVEFAGRTVGEILVGLDPVPLATASSKAHWRILFISFLTLFCGVIGTLWLTRRFIQPITQLSQGVERLKVASGKVSVPILAEDELGELTRNFNAMAADLAAKRQGLIDSADNLERSYHDIVRILAGALDARDNYTYGHSARVAQLAVMLGKQMDLDATQLKELEMACLLHDIGKIRVPDNILNKQAPLDPRENDRIKEHPGHGVEILELADSLHPYIPTVRHHHERYDGSGYPDGLRGSQIPLGAQIVAITDAYDAMTTSRPYRKGLPHEEAVAEILRFRGTQFAPEMTDRFVAMLKNCPIPDSASREER